GGRIGGNSDLEHGSGIVGLHSPEQSSLPELSCSSASRQLPSLLQRFEPIHNDNGFERGVKDGPDRRDETRGRGREFHRQLLLQRLRGIQWTAMHTELGLQNS